MNLASKWRNFLSNNPERENYDDKADSIQQLINPGEPSVNNCRLLSENKTLVCMSKSLLDNQIQLTFFHSIRKIAILITECEFFGIVSFRKRASAVRLDPNVIFKQSKKQRVPSFEEIMEISNKQDIQ